MKWIVLGTSSGRPTGRRNLSGGALVLDGEWVLFDCGEGTQYQLLHTDVRMSRLRYVFVTHMHGDHVLGLPGLLGTLNLARHEAPVDVYGPPGIARFLREAARATYFRPIFPLTVHEIEPGVVLATDAYTVDARRIDHRVPTFGYALRERERPGKFRLEDARRLGIPSGPLYGSLQRGEPVTLDDGRTIAAAEVVDPPRAGRRLAYVTDSGPCDESVDLAARADLLIHEATYTTDMELEARDRRHSTAADAARIAQRAEARHLLITHFSPRYEDSRLLLAEAQAIFPNTTAARDLLELEISYAWAPGDAVPAT